MWLILRGKTALQAAIKLSTVVPSFDLGNAGVTNRQFAHFVTEKGLV